MRTHAIFTVAVLAAGAVGPAAAEEPKRYVERTPFPLIPDAHTHQAAGTCRPIGKCAIFGPEKCEAGGYVGGSGLFRGSGRGVCEGTYGLDYVAFGRRPGRIFLNFLYDRPHQTVFYPKYKTDGPELTDVFGAQPFKKAVKEAKVEKHEGGEGHNGGGHE